MGYEISTIIDKNKCTGCGKCVAVCPYNSIEIIDGKATVTGKKSMHCGQCVAVCAQNAVCVSDLEVPALEGNININTDKLFDAIVHRRSCRDYTPEELTNTDFKNLITFGQWAPSGTNAQKWKFTILPTRKAVESYAELVGDCYRKINKQAKNPLLRLFTKVFMNDALGKYYTRYYKQVKQSLDAWKKERKDLLFHGATSAVVISMSPGAFCAHDDALLASQNMCLGAHTMNIGSCLIGFAVEAMKRDKRIAQKIGIPKDEIVYAVIALGKPKYKYPNPSGRLPVTPRIYNPATGEV